MPLGSVSMPELSIAAPPNSSPARSGSSSNLSLINMYADDLESQQSQESRVSKLSKLSSVSKVSRISRAPPTPVKISVNIANNTGERDRYGFKKKTQFVSIQEYDAWWATYEPFLKRRKKKWVRFMEASGLSLGDDNPIRFPPQSEKLKRYIRKGIPAEWRGNAWFWFAKGHELLNQHIGLYDKLCIETENLSNADTEIIERDLNRTFPDNIYFRTDAAMAAIAKSGSNINIDSITGDEIIEETPLVQSLRRVLTAFSVYQPSIGYCQSMNFIAGLLLLFMDEEKSFWMLVIITQRYLPGVHNRSLEGVNIDQGVLMLCVREFLPDVWQKIGLNFDGQLYEKILSKLPPITLSTASWLMSSFIGILPIETTLRVWDCLIYEESKTFFRIALTIFKLCEPAIMRLRDQMEIFQYIQNYPKIQIDANFLIESCYKRRNGFGHISQEEITKCRRFVRERRRQLQVETEHEREFSNGISGVRAISTFQRPRIPTYEVNSPTSVSSFSSKASKHFHSNEIDDDRYDFNKKFGADFNLNISRRMKNFKKSKQRGTKLEY